MMTDGMGMVGMMIWGIFNLFLVLLLMLLFTVIGVAAVRWLWGKNLPFIMHDRESALDILKKRYAKGEIGKEEFEKMKKDIE
jgi:putative membrane protein